MRAAAKGTRRKRPEGDCVCGARAIPARMKRKKEKRGKKRCKCGYDGTGAPARVSSAAKVNGDRDEICIMPR